MRVAIDARPAAFPHRTGVGTYTANLLQWLPTVDPDSDYVAWYLNAWDFPRRPRMFEDPRLPNLTERASPIPAQWFERSAHRFELPRLEWLVRFDVLFAPNFAPPPTRSSRVVLTVHDLAFRLFPETAPQSTRWWLARFDRALAGAAAVIAVSECTRRDLLELTVVPPERVTVIPHGVDHTVFHRASDRAMAEVRQRFGIRQPYLLFLGGIEPRKNLPNLLRAFALVPRAERPTLVLAGGGVEWNPEGPALLRDALRQLPPEARSRVVTTGYVSEADKVALLSGATALVYPSRYEGFGLPVLEAMSCGTPVLTSNVSALPELAREAAVLVDPDDTEGIRRGMERLLGDPGLRTALAEAGRARAAGFSWEESAHRTAAVLHSVA